jgi:hypothetical protein
MPTICLHMSKIICHYSSINPPSPGSLFGNRSSDAKYLHGEEGLPQWKKPNLHGPLNSIKCCLKVGGPHPQLIRLEKLIPRLH